MWSPSGVDKRAIALGIVLCLSAGVFIYASIFSLWLSLVALAAGLFIIVEGVLQHRTTRALSEESTPPHED